MIKSFLVILEGKQPHLLNEVLLTEHIHFLKKLRKDGVLLICGPMVDNQRGLFILRSNSKEEACELVKCDPFVAHQYYKTFSIHEFQEAGDDNHWLSDSPQTLGNLKNDK